MRLTALQFGSLLTYAPWGTSEAHLRSKTWRTRLKNDEILSSGVPVSDYIADEIKKNLSRLPFADYFKVNPILIPVPSSSLPTKDSLWVPQRIAKALVQHGLGKSVAECVKLIKPIRKSSQSSPENRPSPSEHYDSVQVEKILSKPDEILLVDDIVTRGATLIGTANKVADMFPSARIRAFAAMRTISNSNNFEKINDPCTGIIQLVDDSSFRDP